MPIIKLNAIDSTNSYLKELHSKNIVEDLTVVMTKHQINGRGQMGSNWESQKGKNLTCSVLKRFSNLQASDSFYISMVTSLAIVRTLKSFNIPKLRVKWPNDILSENQKICGILIENVIKNNKIEASIIGVGININQTKFKNLPQASSLKNIKGQLFDVEEILDRLLKHLRYYFEVFNKGNHTIIKDKYENRLFRINKPSSFKAKNGDIFPGYIKGVDPAGNLLILTEDEHVKAFELKEIQLLY